MLSTKLLKVPLKLKLLCVDENNSIMTYENYQDISGASVKLLTAFPYLKLNKVSQPTGSYSSPGY